MSSKQRKRLHDLMAAEAQPVLPAGTEIQQVFLALAHHPLWWWGGIVFNRKMYIAVTPDAIYVLSARMGMNVAKPVAVGRTLPRSTRLGPVRGLFGKINAGERLWVQWVYFPEVRAADAACPEQPAGTLRA